MTKEDNPTPEAADQQDEAKAEDTSGRGGPNHGGPPASGEDAGDASEADAFGEDDAGGFGAFTDGLFTRLNQGRDQLRERISGAANKLLDAVDDFEKRGGISGFIDIELPEALTPPGPYDSKTLRQYYANLETPYGADLNTVKKNYRRLMRKYHPDRHSGDPEREELATRLSQELTRAYQVVSDHLRRREGR